MTGTKVETNSRQVYGAIGICGGVASKDGFYFTKADGTEEEQSKGTPLDIDGDLVCARAISEFGFSLSDFDKVPVGGYGLKMVAETQDKLELYVTANGYFVVYSHGIPSLLGLPSKHRLISGPYVQALTGTVLIPRVSVFSTKLLNTFLMLNKEMSFFKTDIEGNIQLQRAVTIQEGRENSDRFNISELLPQNHDSLYSNNLPKISKSDLESIMIECTEHLESDRSGELSWLRTNASNGKVKPKSATVEQTNTPKRAPRGITALFRKKD